jgi:integrase/recombinase XerD
LSQQAIARGSPGGWTDSQIRTPEKTPHALRHTHATMMWEDGMRELALQRRLGHAAPASMRSYTRVGDEQVLAEDDAALRGRS